MHVEHASLVSLANKHHPPPIYTPTHLGVGGAPQETAPTELDQRVVEEEGEPISEEGELGQEERGSVSE